MVSCAEYFQLTVEITVDAVVASECSAARRAARGRRLKDLHGRRRGRWSTDDALLRAQILIGGCEVKLRDLSSVLCRNKIHRKIQRREIAQIYARA